MRQIILCAAIFAAFVSLAEDADDSPVKKMKAPKHVTLTPEQEKLLADANVALEAAYKLLMNDQDPQKALDELRHAYVISNQLKVLKNEALLAGLSPGNEKDTPKDKIETEGGLEKIVEIAAAAGISAAAEVENGLHKRKIIKKSGDEAKRLEIEQKQLSEQIAWLGAAGTGKPQKNQQPKDQQPPPNPAQPNAAQQGQPQANADAQNQQTPDAQKNQAQPNADPKAQQTPGAQQGQAQPNADPKAQQTPGAQQGQPQPNADPKAQQTPGAQQGQPQPNADPKAQQTPGSQQGQPQPNADPKAQQAGAQGGADDLARKQEEIAKALHKIATDLTPTGMRDPAATKAAQSFRKAADAASQTAQLLRENKVDGAAAASRQVERAIGDAQAAANANGNQRQAETLAAIQQQIDAMQDAQQKVLGQTQQIHKNADGSTAPEAVQKDRAGALAIEEGKLKPQLENVQKALAELGANSDNNGQQNSAQNAAREETANALNELQKGRSKQAVVNATMKLANGEPASAATAMAQVQAALNAAHQRVAAAANALAGNTGKLEQDYRQVQQLAAALRRLEQTAHDAANAGGQGETPDSQQNPDKTKQAATAQNPGKNDGNQKDANPAKPADTAKAEKTEAGKDGKGKSGESENISASWGAVLNHSAEQINADLKKLAPNLAAANPEAAKQIGDLAAKKTSFERDREGSLAQVRALLGAVEKVEADLAKKVSAEDERKAMRNYRKDEIPLPYRKAVASYYEELSKDNK